MQKLQYIFSSLFRSDPLHSIKLHGFKIIVFFFMADACNCAGNSRVGVFIRKCRYSGASIPASKHGFALNYKIRLFIYIAAWHKLRYSAVVLVMLPNTLNCCSVDTEWIQISYRVPPPPHYNAGTNKQPLSHSPVARELGRAVLFCAAHIIGLLNQVITWSTHNGKMFACRQS